MENLIQPFEHFSNKYNRRDDAKPASISDIEKLESVLQIHLPEDFRTFQLNIGNIWTPEILDIVVDNELELNEVQDFWDIPWILEDKKSGWTAQVDTSLIPFASDSMGNIFAFLADDLQERKEKSGLYFFDHDFDTIDKIADSFTNWITVFNEI